MSLGNLTLDRFVVGQASRLPLNDLPTQARRLRYIQKSKSKLFGLGDHSPLYSTPAASLVLDRFSIVTMKNFVTSSISLLAWLLGAAASTDPIATKSIDTAL